MRRSVFFVLALSVLCGCSKRDEKTAGDDYVFAPLVAASAHIAAVEKPDAVKALLVGKKAGDLGPYFVNIGIKPFTVPDGKYDIVVVACSEMSAKSCARLLEYLSDDGVVMWMMDVTGISAGDFRRRLLSFTLAQVHVWMPGEKHWLLTGRKTPRSVKLSAMLDLYSREKAFDDFAFSRCASLQELFASYVGDRESVMPAFERGDLSAEVRPEFFLERNITSVGWISREGVDRDIAAEVSARIRSMRKIRLEVVEGNIASSQAKDRDGESRAIDIWSKAAEKNPNDLFLLERLDRLERNAEGFMAVRKVLMAMKCYETMALIRPDDPVALHNFGMCLKKIGKLDLAEKILDRAKELSK